MNRKLFLSSTAFLWTLLVWSVSQAAGHDPTLDMNTCMPVSTNEFAAKPGDSVTTQIAAKNVQGGTIQWGLVGVDGHAFGCEPATGGASCINSEVTVTVPSAAGDPSTTVVQLSPGTANGGVIQPGDVTFQGEFDLSATDHGGPNGTPRTCDSVAYHVDVTSTGGGWGDPHLTTVDGTNYNFQGAGEYTALRSQDFEVQTRESPVPTAPPAAEAYTGIASCVSVYTAVAVRIGDNRVTYEPNLSGQPDPSGMQLRINGQLTTLPAEGIDLFSNGGGGIEIASKKAAAGKKTSAASVQPPVLQGHVANAATGGGAIEITNTLGTDVVVNPQYWAGQQTWYLNVNAYGTDAILGTMGKILDSWLPGLPDGSSVGQKPGGQDPNIQQQNIYDSLYHKFGDKWRVSDQSSLFDYATGTTTANFTDTSWPPLILSSQPSPSSCDIKGKTTAPTVTVAVAEQACSAVTGTHQHGDCVFDVQFTGNTDFGKSYQVMQQLAPGATQVTLAADKDPTAKGEKVTFSATVAEAVSRGQGVPSGTVQFKVDGQNAGAPVTLDATGKAVWDTSTLSVGEHQIVADYAPVAHIVFLPGTSAPLSHTVTGSNFPWWLIVLIILAILLILWFLRRK